MKNASTLAAFIVLGTACRILHAADPAPPQPSAPPQDIAGYDVSVSAANIALTPCTQPQANVDVAGEPRLDTDHPSTLVDQQELEELKAQIKAGTNKELMDVFNRLKKECDGLITKPLDVPVPRQNPDGTWMFPGDFPPDVSPHGPKALSGTHIKNASALVDLGMAYQLTGDAKYAEYARKILLAYADSYNKWGHPKDWTIKKYRSAQDGRLSWQFLNDGFWLITAAFGYDLVYSLPSFTAEDHNHIRDDLFKPVVEEFIDPVLGKPDYLSSENNRSAICAAGTLIAGYATEDSGLINDALYGGGGTKESPTGGMLQAHFGEKGLLPDGMWVEGSPAYQIGILSSALIDDAQTLWHHGMDMYRFRGGALKRLLDSNIVMAYPDAKMDEPKPHDSGDLALLDSRNWMNQEEGTPYEYGYQRYRDAAYLPIIRNATKSLGLSVHAGAPSLFPELPLDGTDRPHQAVSANFYSVGYGLLRLSTPTGANQLIMEYGPFAGHAHPSKLSIDLYALNQPLMSFPGSIFPYNDPLDAKWYETTLANGIMEVDEKEQVFGYKVPRGLSPPAAQQLIFAPSSTMGLQRAWSNTINRGITQDRALFLTPEYLADIFGAFANAPHTYDMTWHIAGQMTTSLPAEPFQFPDPAANGYNALTNLTHATTDQSWSATIATADGQTARLFSPAESQTEVIFASGPSLSTKGQNDLPTIIERRTQNSSIYGNVTDVSGLKDGYLKDVTQQGSLDIGYSLLKINTLKGTDLCFVSYRPGNYSIDGLETDAMQAFVRMDGANVTGLYLAGGRSLKVTGGSIERNTPGLSYVEKTLTGSYIVGNPSAEEASVTIRLPALAGLKAFNLDEDGNQTGTETSANGPVPGSVVFDLKGSSRVVLIP